jgi:two-component system, chemotaxis family, protein-glutamate methylesterase/glutaminase
MSGPIRVLVIDDSRAVRMIVTKVFGSEPDIEVIGQAENGAEGVVLARQLRPDIITCDVEMPVMDGLATVTELKRLRVDAPIIMFSSLTEAGSRATLEALSRGASDYLPKPMGVNGAEDAMERLRRDLVPKVRALAGARRTQAAAAAAPPVRRPAATSHVAAVVLGCSTGGPSALEQVFAGFHAPLPVPMLVVQHIPPVFSGMLAERLDRVSPMKVVEAEDHMPVTPGTAYIAPGGRHMVVRPVGVHGQIALHDGPPVNSCRPAVDVLFGSAAEVYRGHQLGVILTGMGQDGLSGCRALTEVGASVVVQDEPTSVVWAMPGVVANAGLAEEILPIDRVASAIERRVGGGRGAERRPAAEVAR